MIRPPAEFAEAEHAVGETPDALFAGTDKELDEAKESGSNRIRVQVESQFGVRFRI